MSRVDAFTMLELIVVIAVILILVGVVLAAAGYVQKKGARSRAETEIAALSAALESYKADNAIYPRDDSTNKYTDNLDPRINGNPTETAGPNSQNAYQNASQFLYGELSGDRNFNNVIDNAEQTNRTYFNFKPAMLYTTTSGNGNAITITVKFIRDPFANSYGYSTANQSDASKGHNPTYDLWSTAGVVTNGPPSISDQQQWIKNW